MNRIGVLAVNLGLLCSANAGTIFFNNLGDSSIGSRTILTPEYQSFSTGGAAVVLGDVQVALAGNIDAHSLSVDVYSDTGGPAPGALFANVGTLSDSLLPGSGIQTYDFPVPIALAASTRYWIGISTANGSDAIWQLAFFNGSDVGVTGQFVDDTGVVSSDTSEVFLMKLTTGTASSVPEPSTLLLGALGLLVLAPLRAWQACVGRAIRPPAALRAAAYFLNSNQSAGAAPKASDSSGRSN